MGVIKKPLALILAAALVLSLVACGGGGDSASEETSKPQSLKVGDTYTGNKFEITLTNVEFADKLNTDCTSEYDTSSDFRL